MATFREQLKQFFAKTFKGFYIEVTKPKKFLLDCGVPNLPIKIAKRTLQEKISKHNLTKEHLQNLNTQINKPLLVFHSETMSGAFNVIIENSNDEGVLCCSLHTDKKVEKIYINEIASIHGRRLNQLVKWAEDGCLIDGDKDKTRKAFSGSQFNSAQSEYLLSLLDTAKLKQKNQNTKGLGKNILGFLGFEGLGKLVNHNTPHLLQREDGSFVDPETGLKLGFDNRHMGSGEGAQVYGWGVYLSVDDLRKYGNLHKRNIRIKEEIFDCNFIQYGQIVSVPLRATRDEVKAYKLALTAGNIASHFDLYDCSKKDVENYIKSLIDEINTKIKNKEKEFSQTQSFTIKREIDSNKQRLDDYKYLLSHVKVKAVRHHYDVEIPDYDGKNYLPWQKAPNKQQFDMISTVLTPTQANEIKKSWNGKDIYRYFVKIFKTPEKASKTLYSAGFLGIHYYGHTDGECYVIFNDQDAKIVRHELYGLEGVNNAQMQDKELDIVLKAKDIIEKYYRKQGYYSGQILPLSEISKCYNELVTLYNHQPIIQPKDHKALALQQYSTPCPIAYLMGEFVKLGGEYLITDKGDKFQKTYYEPTAGNGMLTIALPTHETWVNELDEIRYDNLLKLSSAWIARTQNNATEWRPYTLPMFAGVIMNPPFGSLKKSEYCTRKGTIENREVEYTFERLDYKIAVNALDCMRDDGKAAIIIGGKLSAKTYNDYKTSYWKNGKLFGQYREFVAYLHRQYNIVDIIYINGDLYRKQGTTFPIVIILIDGRTQWNDDINHVWHKYNETTDRQINSFSELFERMYKQFETRLPSQLLLNTIELTKIQLKKDTI